MPGWERREPSRKGGKLPERSLFQAQAAKAERLASLKGFVLQNIAPKRREIASLRRRIARHRANAKQFIQLLNEKYVWIEANKKAAIEQGREPSPVHARDVIEISRLAVRLSHAVQLIWLKKVWVSTIARELLEELSLRDDDADLHSLLKHDEGNGRRTILYFLKVENGLEKQASKSEFRSDVEGRIWARWHSLLGKYRELERSGKASVEDLDFITNELKKLRELDSRETAD